MKTVIFDHNKLNRTAFYDKKTGVLFISDLASDETRKALIQRFGK